MSLAATPEGEPGYRVLVVDDEPVNVQALVNYLTLAKYAVATAATGHRPPAKRRWSISHLTSRAT